MNALMLARPFPGMSHRKPIMSMREKFPVFLIRLGRLACLGGAALLAACQTAPVDFAPVKPIDYTHTKEWGTPTNGSLFQARTFRIRSHISLEAFFSA